MFEMTKLLIASSVRSFTSFRLTMLLVELKTIGKLPNNVTSPPNAHVGKAAPQLYDAMQHFNRYPHFSKQAMPMRCYVQGINSTQNAEHPAAAGENRFLIIIT
jgi:hypothetical protein